MEPNQRSLSIIEILLYVLTVLDIAIVIFDLVTKGTVGWLMIIATIACVCASAGTLLNRARKK